MTIAALDAEMLRRQNLSPAVGECARDSGGGAARLFASQQSSAFAQTVGGPAKTPPQLNKKLRVVFGITQQTSGPFCFPV
jgi:hypothetical protein